MAVYETFIIEDLSELKDGQEQELQVRNTDTYEVKKVKAIIASAPDKLPNSDVLTVRWQRGQPIDQPWAIKIIEDLGGAIDE